jgi:hypothetical protein
LPHSNQTSPTAEANSGINLNEEESKQPFNRRGFVFQPIGSKSKPVPISGELDPFSGFDFSDPPPDDQIVLKHLETHIRLKQQIKQQQQRAHKKRNLQLQPIQS